MNRRTLCCCVAVLCLLSGCAGWGGGEPLTTRTTDGPDRDVTHLKGLFDDVSAAENGSLVVRVEVFNIRQSDFESTMTVTAEVNGTTYRASRSVSVPAEESKFVNVTIPEVNRSAFSDGGKLTDLSFDPN